MNLLSMITTSSIGEWNEWTRTASGQRDQDYEDAKEDKARRFIAEATKAVRQLE